MRIKFIQLSWFRGAADTVSLDLNGRSMVVYGVNGSGKSSFVDAVEYILNDGKIGHLTHEYSGRRQEKAIPNTHRPEGRKTEVRIKFQDDSELKTEISQDGSPTSSGAETVAMGTWDYRRTVLRQDEVATFIRDTKGNKYSALLPLLGLHKMEVAGENLRQLARSIEEQARIKETKTKLQVVEEKRQSIFGGDSYVQILTRLEGLYKKYCAEKVAPEDAMSCCLELQTALDTRISVSSIDQRRHVALQDTAALAVENQVDRVRDASARIAAAVEPLLARKLDVLESAGRFVGSLGDEKEVVCPACGQVISVYAFKEHVKAEQVRLQEIIENVKTRKAAIGTLCDTLKSMKFILGKADIKTWRHEVAQESLNDNFAYLDSINTDDLRVSCNELDLKAVEDKLLPLIDAAASASKDAPPDAQQLSTDQQTAETGKAVIALKEQATAAERAETLVDFVRSLEQGIREEIRLSSRAVIDEISKDIQTMWAILHPGKAIEDVRIYLPEDADKAIDIGLSFHGVMQDSPRLTLSEGYRNGLGLCIFLSMAKREADRDRPLLLDDVVVSLDRNHRGMIAELLEREFNERQVVILTHDREWYTELRHQLNGKNWNFKALLPYETPALGIRWSHKTTTFDDARAQLEQRSDSAGNDARKIMDVELALIAERLQIRLPYLRADKNDKRMAHDFIERLVADGKKCFQKKAGDGYEVYVDALNSLEHADRLLVSWANRASHTFDLERGEAAKLIEVCEKTLEFFKCSSCGKGVWFADAEGSEWVQCQCGQIRWRYGKG
jgi:energy-coupling factor transporter ATP-binding protein EcfA2